MNINIKQKAINEQTKQVHRHSLQCGGDHRGKEAGVGGRGYKGSNMWSQKETEFWVGSTQWDIQMMCNELVHVEVI